MSLAGIIIALGDMVDSAVRAGRERAQEARAARGRQASTASRAGDRGGARARPVDLRLAARLTISFLPVFALRGAGGAAVQAARAHEDVLDGVRVAPRDHARARADGHLRAREDPPRAEEPDQPGLHRRLPAGAPLRACAHRYVVDRASWSALLAVDRVSRSRGSAPSSCRRSTRRIVLFMPITVPGISIEEAKRAAPEAGRGSSSAFPEVELGLRQGGARRDARTIRRRCRCSRPSCTSSRASSGGPA